LKRFRCFALGIAPEFCGQQLRLDCKPTQIMTCECRRPASTTPVTVGEPRSITGPLHPESREQPCRILPICPLIPGPYLLDESSFTTQVPTFFCDQTGSSFAPCLTSPIPSSWKFRRQCFCNFLLVRGRSCCVRGHEPGHQLQDDLFRFAGTKCQSLASVPILYAFWQMM